MKTVSKNFWVAMFTNSINRNLILILLATLIVATVVVTGSIIIYNQW